MSMYFWNFSYYLSNTYQSNIHHLFLHWKSSQSFRAKSLRLVSEKTFRRKTERSRLKTSAPTVATAASPLPLSFSHRYADGPRTARSGKLYRARSWLYRGQILQENMRWKALGEIYTMHSFAQLCNRNFCQNFAKIFAKFCKFQQNFWKISQILAKF